MSLLMWGVVYQGYNAVFPSFYPELFPTRTRVSAMAISQNLGTAVTALLPALFAAVAPPGSTNIPLTIGAITFAITAVAACAALSARETYRVHMNDLGNPNAVPVPKPEYDRLREQAIAATAWPSREFIRDFASGGADRPAADHQPPSESLGGPFRGAACPTWQRHEPMGCSIERGQA